MDGKAENSDTAAKPYRWVILAVIVLVQIALNAAQFQVAGLAGRIIGALGLSSGQFAMVLAAPMLTAALFGIPAGAMADRFGVRVTVAIGLCIAAASCFGRIGSDSFGTLFFWMLALGFGLATVNANGAKIIGAWFPASEAGLAMGVFVAAATVGISVALATSALFTSVREAYLISAAAALAVLLLWILLVRSRPANLPETPPHPVIEYLKAAGSSRNVWLGAAAMFLFMGAWVAQTGNLSNALTKAKAVSDVLAGLTASLLPLAFIGGSVGLGPVIIRQRGRLKALLAPIAFAAAAFSYIGWIIPFGPVTFILLLLAGFLLGTLVPLVMSLPMLLPELGPAYAGSAGGIISTLQMAGAFLLPSYIIMPIAGSSVSTVFLLISCSYALFGIVLLFIPVGEER